MKVKELIYKLSNIILQVILLVTFLTIYPAYGVSEFKINILGSVLILLICLLFFGNKNLFNQLYLSSFAFLYMQLSFFDLVGNNLANQKYYNILLLISSALFYMSGPFYFLRQNKVSNNIPILFLVTPFLSFYLITNYVADIKIQILYGYIILVSGFIYTVFFDRILNAFWLSEVLASFLIIKSASLGFNSDIFIESILFIIISILYYIFEFFACGGKNFRRNLIKVCIFLIPILTSYSLMNVSIVFYLLLSLWVTNIYEPKFEVSNYLWRKFCCFISNYRVNVSNISLTMPEINFIRYNLTFSMVIIFVSLWVIFMVLL